MNSQTTARTDAILRILRSEGDERGLSTRCIARILHYSDHAYLTTPDVLRLLKQMERDKQVRRINYGLTTAHWAAKAGA